MIEEVRYTEDPVQSFPNASVGNPGKGKELDPHLKSVRMTKETGQVHINKTQYFENVPKDVWEFEIGGDQVLEKWLRSHRDKKENTLSSVKSRKRLYKYAISLRLPLSRWRR